MPNHDTQQPTDAQVEQGYIRQITCADDEGWFSVKAAVYVDTSGDANLARMAGASTQWGDSYPPRELIEEDILSNRLFVCVINGEPVGKFCY